MGHVEVVRCLLDALDALSTVDARDALGATALWAAARNGRVQVTELLLEKKAQQDMEIDWHPGWWLVMLVVVVVVVVVVQDVEVAEEIGEIECAVTPCFWACQDARHRWYSEHCLFRVPASFQDARDIDGETPLRPASNSGWIESWKLPSHILYVVWMQLDEMLAVCVESVD